MGCCYSAPALFDALPDPSNPASSERANCHVQPPGLELVSPVEAAAPTNGGWPGHKIEHNEAATPSIMNAPVTPPESCRKPGALLCDAFASSMPTPGRGRDPSPPSPPPAPRTQPPAAVPPSPAPVPAPAMLPIGADLNPKYMTLGQLKKALREHGAEPEEGARKEALQAQLSDLRGLDSSTFKAASAAQAEQLHQREASMAARRNAVEAALVAGPPKRPRSLAEPLAQAATGQESFQGWDDRAESALEGHLEAPDEHGLLSRSRPAGARRPPSRKLLVGAAGGGVSSTSPL
mmetsp:Transcript_32053/g.103427  ORF Transcript_32053/g.103427 Transcript_32053/m.103427 type:complete len:292 (+) Transcript_32053:36-911(+)